MKQREAIGLVAALAIVAVVTVGVGLWLRRPATEWVEGEVTCTSYRLASKVAGRIDTLWVAEGDRVERGAPLYTLSTPELQAKLQQVEALRRAAEAMDAMAEAGARRQQIEAARSLWQRAEAGLVLAEKSYTRAERLFAAGVIPQQQLDEATAERDAMRASVAAAYAEYTLARAGARREEREAAAAKVSEAQGAVEEVVRYLADARITAPVSGEVVTVAAEVGELVGVGYPVITLLDRADVWVALHIREDQLPAVRIGSRLTGYLPALDRTIPLRVTYIAPEADFATWRATRAEGGFDLRTFALRARPEEQEEGLRAGMSVWIDWRTIER